MTDQRDYPSEEQLRALQIAQRIRMAWVLFYFMLVLTAAAFILLIVAVFFTKAEAWVKIGMFLFNGILGGSINTLHQYLFPKAN